jgi:hypothetical protein
VTLAGGCAPEASALPHVTVSQIVGPIGVRALLLAAGINEGGHYFW